ncbi:MULTISPECIES: LysR family transcriptional regulator [Lactobacillus]|uniref:LysR family transcriptional regulator n=1 Tax=Lactobacillus xujianguonis TaxID=2495899 RepID=A0A437SXU7_9LACO|nr:MULTISPECIES: LysR family transcriptional regulator [Lactobacillus]RVU71753.1 LysR family transcriptional regulator [Lactobacillus xujianguonis]RVU77583.1 LysR family transcriptional regulator [Lactobacillus xujianguonis]
MPKTDTILSAKSLRYFLQLIDTMNYTQAAQILGITQPALTQQIKKLEHAIGVPLFGQMGKKLYLTEAGKEMETAAVELLGTINSVVNDIQEFTQADKGSISIGILENLDLNIFRKFLIEFNKEFPDVTIDVNSFNRRELWQQLDNNLIDIAIMYLPDTTKRNNINLQQQYDHSEVYEDQMVVLTHKDTVDANETYPVSRFTKRKWVAYPKTFYLSKLMDDVYGKKNKPIIPMRFSSTSDLVKVAENSDLDTFVTKSYYEAHKQKISLTPVFLKNSKSFEISLVYRKGKMEIPRIENLLTAWADFLKQKDYSSRLQDR